MSRTSARLVGIGLLGVSLVHCGSRPAPFETELPAPSTTGRMSLEEALATRRSIRSYDDEPLSTTAIGQLAWAAQGITDPRGYRTAPSAGALYPLEIFVVTRDGVDRYVPQ